MLHGITWQNALVLTIFVAMCGFIAYWGDLLGRRMGKRRLSLFGLRPRYTAIAVTTINGMIIAALTIGIMATVSQRVRLLLLQGNEIISQQKRLEKQLKTTRQDYERASGELQVQTRAAEDARAEAGSARKQLEHLRIERDRLTNVLQVLKADLSKKQTDLSHAVERLRVATGDLREAKKELADRRTEISQQQMQIKWLAARRKRLEDQIGLLAQNLGEAADKWTQYIALREGNIIFRLGDEMSRRVIPSSGSPDECRRLVLEAISEADDRARKMGAKAEEDGNAIEILPVKAEGGSGKADLKDRFVPESMRIDAIVDNIRNNPNNTVFRVICLNNTVEGEPVLVNFVMHPNKLIYKAGEEVASTIIDGSQSESMVFGGLQAFFRNDVRISAMRNGVIPSLGEDGELSVGQYPGDKVFSLFDSIRLAGRPVRVTAVALTDIWSADSLVLDIDISEAQ